MIALTNGKIITVTQGTYENGTVLIENGVIKAVGENIEIPADAMVIDVNGGVITPGFIEPHSHLALTCEPNTMPGHMPDYNEITDPITPHIRALDAIDHRDIGIKPVREAGFTTIYTGPGSANIIGGTGLAIKLRGNSADEMLIPGSEMMKFALGENPKRCYGPDKKMPMSRMGTAALLRQTLMNAKLYHEKKEKYVSEPEKQPAYDFKLESLAGVVKGTMRCRIHCHRSDDINTAIRVATEFGLDFIVEHCTEGYLVKEILADKKVRCIFGPMHIGPMKQEVWNINLEAPGICEKAGVDFALMQDGAMDTQWLPHTMGILIRRGLSEEMAFKAITINAARFLNLDDRIGSIEVGKDADIAVFDGHPFSSMTLCRLTMIDGVIHHNTL